MEHAAGLNRYLHRSARTDTSVLVLHLPAADKREWNVRQAARGGKVMVLTTHFMDEADILGDRIGDDCAGPPLSCGPPPPASAR